MMTDVQRTYLPAAGHNWSLPLYDPLVKLLGVTSPETGTLLMLLTRAQPALEVTGLDPDVRALARAKRKADAGSVSIQLDRGFSDSLPYPEASFDRVFSCFMLHHLNGVDEKVRTLREIRRVLKPGGQLHLLDFAQPEVHSAGLVARWMHSNHRLEDNTDVRVRSFMDDAGLVAPTTLRRAKMFFVFGLAYYQAFAPS